MDHIIKDMMAKNPFNDLFKDHPNGGKFDFKF
jgi:hypothetical protein